MMQSCNWEEKAGVRNEAWSEIDRSMKLSKNKWQERGRRGRRFINKTISFRFSFSHKNPFLPQEYPDFQRQQRKYNEEMEEREFDLGSNFIPGTSFPSLENPLCSFSFSHDSTIKRIPTRLLQRSSCYLFLSTFIHAYTYKQQPNWKKKSILKKRDCKD